MHTHIGMAGKITDEMIFDAERRSKLSETIVGAMTEEERSNPDLIVATVPMMDEAYIFIYTDALVAHRYTMLCYACTKGGKKELVQDAERRKRELADRSGTTIKEVRLFALDRQ